MTTTTLADLTWPVNTERLAIRPVRVEDAEAIWAYRQLPEVSLWTGSFSPEHDAWLKSFFSDERIHDALVVEHEGRIVGDLMVKLEDGWAQHEVKDQVEKCQAELGWTFDPAVGGRGLATESVHALFGICFDGLGLRRVIALCFADNEPSWRLMERVGMRREQHNVSESLHAERGWRDGYGYALLADEWRASSG
jgi:RimJ/RimL family protein N-acetyltransferase